MSNQIANTVTTNILPVQALYDPTSLAFITFIGPAGLPFTSAAGGVSSVDVSGGSTGLTTSGGPIVSSGTITLGGTLSVSNGGTGATTSTGALTNLLPTQTGNAGKYLITDGSTTSWSTAGAGLSIVDDTTTNATKFLTFTSASSGTVTTENVASTKLTFNPSSGTLSSTTFVGALTGNASTATLATSATNVAGGVANALVYQGSTGSTSFLSPGSNGQYLTLTGGVPTWASLSTVTSFSGGTTGFTPSTASTGVVTLAGTLNVANGGTGVTSSSGANSVVLRDANGNITTNCLFEGYTSQAASGTSIVLTASSPQNLYITGSGGQTIQLPNATTLPNGALFTFNNNQTSGAITVINTSSTTIATINSGGYVTVVLNSNSVSAGTWDRHDSTPSNVSWSTNTLDYPGSITSATWNGTAIAINRGGTNGTATPTSGAIAYGNGTAYAFTAAGTTGQVLTSNGSGTPTWSTITTAITVSDDTTTNATRYPLFTSATSGTITTEYTSSSKYQYNPSTGVLSATGFSGSGSSLTFGTGTLSLAGNLTTSGAYALTLTQTASTNVTLPTSGTVISSVTALSGAVTGTPSSSTYLRGDGTWATVTAGVSTGKAIALAMVFGF